MRPQKVNPGRHHYRAIARQPMPAGRHLEAGRGRPRATFQSWAGVVGRTVDRLAVQVSSTYTATFRARTAALRSLNLVLVSLVRVASAGLQRLSRD
jgi:hypothetical protein